MEYQLKIRIDLQLQNRPALLVTHILDEGNIQRTLLEMNPHSTGSVPSRGTVVLGGPGDGYPIEAIRRLSDISENIAFFDIHTNVDLEHRHDHVPLDPALVIKKHAPALSALRYKLKGTHIHDCEIVRVTDHRTRSTYHVLPEDDSVGLKYRLYMDGAMLIERFYPYEDVGVNEQLEELVFVDILPGEHEISIERIELGRNRLLITDFSAESTSNITARIVDRNINDTRHSFQIQ